MSTSSSKPAHKRELFGHPIGLYILFFTEMWERFSYYGMRAILVLYIVSEATGENPGLGWTEENALALYGWYTMMVYVMAIPGGIIADKFIGQKKSVLLGGLILVAGHSILAVEQMWAFYTGLILIVVGVGGLKPNISTMVGGLYEMGDIRRDEGFTIFYIGINIGAALAALVVGYVGETIGWHYGFGLAGIGMLLGQIVFMAGQRYLKGVGEPPSKEEQEEADDSLGRLLSKMFDERIPLTVFGLIELLGLYMIVAAMAGWPVASVGYGLLTMFIGLVVGLMMVIYKELNEIQKDRYVVLLLSFIIVIVFWGAFEQAGGLMNIYTKDKVDRVVSQTTFDIIGYGGALAMILYGLIVRGFSWKKAKGHIIGGVGVALLYTAVNAIWLNKAEFLIPASVFQSVNAIFIIIFGTIVAAFWTWRARSGGESSSLYKMAIGTIVMGLGFLFMAKASLEVLSTGQAALIWIILAYLFHTIGELSASPVALSFITKLAPAKYVSLMMGVYFAATGLGNKVAGAIGEASQTDPVQVEISDDRDMLGQYVADSVYQNAALIELEGYAYLDSDGQLVMTDTTGQPQLSRVISMDGEGRERLQGILREMQANTVENRELITLKLENREDHARLEVNPDAEVSLSNYQGDLRVFEHANRLELKTFLFITGFTSLFGILLIVFLKRLKKLTHGAEEDEGTFHEEQEGFEIADKE